MQRCDNCHEERERLTFTASDKLWLCRDCREAPLTRSSTMTQFIRGAGEPVKGRDYAVVKRNSY